MGETDFGVDLDDASFESPSLTGIAPADDIQERPSNLSKQKKNLKSHE